MPTTTFETQTSGSGGEIHDLPITTISDGDDYYIAKGLDAAETAANRIPEAQVAVAALAARIEDRRVAAARNIESGSNVMSVDVNRRMARLALRNAQGRGATMPPTLGRIMPFYPIRLIESAG